MEQAIHNVARESLEIIERKEKKPKHTAGNKKLGQLTKARRIAIKQKNRIIHALINKQGTDGCSAKILKSLLPEGVKTICKLYNYCLEGGTLLEKWKEGQITLIYKKGAP